MSRQKDPNEPGAMPRSQFANSAGSQFFICVNYHDTRQLDRRNTACGRVVKGIQTVNAIASVPLAEGSTDRPQRPPRIDRIEIKPVTSKDNPYQKLAQIVTSRPTTQP